MGTRFTDKEIKSRVKLAHGDQVQIDISTYVNAATKARFIDVDYGEWWAQPAAIFAGGRHRQRFHDALKQTLSQCKERLFEVHGNVVSVIEQSYKSAYEKCSFIDIEFGQWEAKPHNVLNGHGHPERGLQNRKATWTQKYGCDNPFKSDEVQERVSRSNNLASQIQHWKTHKELICIASYEVAFVNWCNTNHIDFDWQIVHKMSDGRKYRIDAYIKDGMFANTWIEIKGWFRDSESQEKWEWFHQTYLNSQLWNKSRLKELGII